MHFDKQSEQFMRRAIELAQCAWGETHPNPMVGALVVHEGSIASEGFHKKSGTPHAEINAINAFKETPNEDTTLYITLEPCSTVGRTGACTNAIIRSGIRKVVVGAVDPNPVHAGQGITYLKDRGLEVICGVLEEECRDLNLLFNHWIVHRECFCALKVAMTIDGSLAASNGQSKWITSREAREDVMRWRRLFPAILVSHKTVQHDNPELTSRTPEAIYCPRRFILNRSLKDLDACSDYKVFSDQYKERTTIVYGESASLESVQKLESLGISAWKVKESRGRIDMADFLKRCSEESLLGVFIEAGAELSTCLLNEKLVHYLFIYQAPKLLLDSDACALGSSRMTKHIDEAIHLERIQRKSFKEDTLVRGYLRSKDL